MKRNARHALDGLIYHIVWSELPSEREDFTKQRMEDPNDLNVMPCDCLTETESIPYRRKRIKEYQQSYL